MEDATKKLPRLMEFNILACNSNRGSLLSSHLNVTVKYWSLQ